MIDWQGESDYGDDEDEVAPPAYDEGTWDYEMDDDE